MSSLVRAFVMRELLDSSCVEDALKEMQCDYLKEGNIIRIRQNLTITLTANGAEVSYNLRDSWQNEDVNSFMQTLAKTYAAKLEQKIEILKMNEARARENEVLGLFKEEERRTTEVRLRNERMRLEAIKRREEESLRLKIIGKVAAIKEKAKHLGYGVKEETREKEVVLVLIKR
jgi:hypothetical protein